MINAITSWIFGDIEHLDPAEAYALTITKQDMTAEDVVHAARCAVGDSYYDYNPTTKKLMSPYHWPHIPKDEARAACQVLSDYKAWAYFDSCSYEQLIRHLQKRIFKGVDV